MLALSIFLLYAAFYIFFQSYSIFGGDAGDLVSAAFTGGIAHPPGYPLYTTLGHLLTKLPINTAAWRVGLLSSLPAAITLTLLFLLLTNLTKNKTASIIAVSSLSFSYLFWLYAAVPEVFALQLLFQTLLLYTLFKERFLLFFFLFGLSLTHHHIILFLLPAFLYFLYTKRKQCLRRKSQLFKYTIAFCLGLLPYFYILYAAPNQSLINWANPINLHNFIKLVTRADYGTFQSGSTFAQSLTSRFLQLPVMFEFMKTDFTIVGIFIALVGAFSQFKRNRRLFYFFFLGFLFVGPFFFFYASYSLITSFSLGTVERFLLPSYLFVTIWIGEGATYLTISRWHPQKESRSHTVSDHILYYGIFIILLILPLSLLFINFPKIFAIKRDFVAENYAEDLINTAEKNSIFILQRDTALFNTQYVYFTQQKRPDIKLIHYYRLSTGEVLPALKKHYPTLSVPQFQKNYLDAFIAINYNRFPVFANVPLAVDPKLGGWVHEGLLYQFYKPKDLPSLKNLLAKNDKLWQQYHDPLKNRRREDFALMPSNVLDFYKEGLVESGKLFEGAGDSKTALSFYQKALPYDKTDVITYYLLSRAYSTMEECDKGKSILAQSLLQKITPLYFQFMGNLYKNCYKDTKKAAKYFDVYKKQTNTEVKLKEL